MQISGQFPVPPTQFNVQCQIDSRMTSSGRLKNVKSISRSKHRPTTATSTQDQADQGTRSKLVTKSGERRRSMTLT